MFAEVVNSLSKFILIVVKMLKSVFFSRRGGPFDVDFDIIGEKMSS